RINFCALLILLILSVKAQQPPPTSKPNVILILADDMGIGDIAALNGGLNNTPALDGLLHQSVWFNQGYSGSAVCAPARAALLTGRYPHRTGVVSLSVVNFPTLTSLGLHEQTMADVLQATVYHTGLVCKWHLGIRPEYHPMKRGFREFRGFMGPDIKTYYKFQLDSNGVRKAYDGPYLTDVLTEQAIDYVRAHQGEPFFLHLAYYAPHRPLGAPEELVASYQEKGYDLKTAKIYAMIEIMDRGIGKLLDELDMLNIRENTIVVFASDNGPDPLTGERFNQQLNGRKYAIYEGGIRVPLFFHWKGKFTAHKVDEVAHFTDMLPTLSELCQLEVDKTVMDRLDGGSLAGLISGNRSAKDLPKARYWQWNRGVPYYTHNAAMREGDWKLVYPPVTTGLVDSQSTSRPMLFNLKSDPAESTDVSAANPGIFGRMKVMLEDWSRKVEADRLKATAYDN